MLSVAKNSNPILTLVNVKKGENMNIEKYRIGNKDVTLYHSKDPESPLIILNNYSGDGKSVMEAAIEHGNKDFNLLCISNLNWDHDMTPWYCPPTSPHDTPCTGGAEAYLKILLDEILPDALRRVSGTPSHISIAGYSLAGLFALYAMYKTDIFDRVASMSGSLWFPDFKEYVLSNAMKKKPEKIYISLGNKESKTRNVYLKKVQENTEKIVDYYKSEGYDVTFELNQGNHFKDAALRSAKGILAII